MTPVPLDLPLRPSEASELAGLIFESAERKPLTEDIRNRIAARAAALRFETIAPFYGSLERDPVHHSTYYLVVDVPGGTPYLLHMALATAPTSSIFAKPLLIGRMRRAGGPEIVINALPFGPGDYDALGKFAGLTGTAFLPRPHGSRTTIVAGAGDFETFRAIRKRTGRNVAAIGAEADFAAAYHAGLWAAIRGGWRNGYSAVARIVSKEQVQDAALFSTFVVEARGGRDEALASCQAIHTHLRQTRSALKINRPFDFELALDRVPARTTAGELGYCLEWLKARGHAAQLAAPNLSGASEEDIRELAGVCRQFQCSLDFSGDPAMLETVVRATAGRLTCSLWNGGSIEQVAEALG